MSETVRSFIERAARLANILPQGQSFNGTEIQDALANFNDMIDALNVERTNLYTVKEITLILNASKQAWTVGTGAADFPAVERPEYIDPDTIALITPDTLRHPVRLLTQSEWSQVPERGIQGRLVDRIYCDFNWPVATIQVLPIPTLTGGNPVLSYVQWVLLTGFTDLNATLSFPPGYSKALRFLLAVNLASEFPGAVLSPETIQIAATSKAEIQARNLKMALQNPLPSVMPPAPAPQPAPQQQQ